MHQQNVVSGHGSRHQMVTGEVPALGVTTVMTSSSDRFARASKVRVH